MSHNEDPEADLCEDDGHDDRLAAGGVHEAMPWGIFVKNLIRVVDVDVTCDCLRLKKFEKF